MTETLEMSIESRKAHERYSKAQRKLYVAHAARCAAQRAHREAEREMENARLALDAVMRRQRGR